MTNPILTASNLKKTFEIPVKTGRFFEDIFRPKYKKFDAVEDLNLVIQPGEKVAFLGPNGAGKSTAIKMFCGILSPTSGSLSVCGFNPLLEREKLSYHIGALFGQTSKLAYHLTPLDSYKLLGKLYNIPGDRLRRRLDYLFAAFNMSDIINLPVRKLSLGQRMRAELIASLLHTPKLLFLDEPTIGLDMMAKSQLRDVINTLNSQEGTTILLTSHDIGDVEQICDRVVIINHGGVVFDGGLHELKKEHVTSKIIHVRFDQKTTFVPKDFMTLIDTQEDAITLSISNETSVLKDTLSYLIDTYSVEDLSITEPDTESIIRNFYVGKK